MRKLTCLSFFALLVLTQVAYADDLLDPAAYFKILEDSPLRYNISDKPSATPAKEVECPRRDETKRVVVRDGTPSMIDWEIKPEARTRLQEGEVLFQQEKYDQAAEKYKEAIEADPQAVSAYLYYGDALLFGGNDPAAALAQYRKGIDLDPTLPSAHFFASTAYSRLGKIDEARNEVIKALTYYPGYEVIWRLAAQKPAAWKIKPVRRHEFNPPVGYLGTKGKNGIDIFPGLHGEWLGYAMCKAVWENEKKFEKRSANGGWSLEEERACVLNQLMGAYNTAASKLEEQNKKRGRRSSTEIASADVVEALPSLERHLFEVMSAHLLDGYILFEIIGRHCPLALATMDENAREQVEQYIREYVIVAAE